METTSKYAHAHSTANPAILFLTGQDDPSAQNTVKIVQRNQTERRQFQNIS
jgi:hypothetical protein